MKPYDWDSDPECSWLRHPAGRHLVRVDVQFAPAWWWWVALVAALSLTFYGVGQLFFGTN